MKRWLQSSSQPFTLHAVIWSCLAACAFWVEPNGAISQTPVSQDLTPRAEKAARPPVDPKKFSVIISGASGEESYAKQFADWMVVLRRTLIERFGFGEDHVIALSEKPLERISTRATAEEVRRTFRSLEHVAKPESTLFIFFIGHGTFDGKQAKFNLAGPDLSAGDYNTLISSIPARRVIIFNMASASGEFIKPLSGNGRIIITATRSGQEQNATRFTEYFLAALSESKVDADQNGRISVLETFNYASRQTAEFYTRAGRLATEHALLEDNGDGAGHQTVEGGDGQLARVTYLDSLTADEAATNAEMAKLLSERARLEEEIEQLKARKSQMQGAEYETDLERLFVTLAKTNRSLKKHSN